MIKIFILIAIISIVVGGIIYLIPKQEISETCVPETCLSLNKGCGTWEDICGGILNCGDCSTDYVCSAGICVDKLTCTGTCLSLDYECGTYEICGVLTNCGTCGTGYTCTNGQCQIFCTPHLSYTCYNDDVYWYDSCNVREEIKEDCETGEFCENGICVTAGCDFDDDYKNYLNSNPKIKSLIGAYDVEIKEYLCNYIDELETTGSISISEPSCLESNPGESRTCFLDTIITKKILAAKSAHAIWLDKNSKVPWKLEDYSIDELKLIFRDELDCKGCIQDYFKYIVDYSPSLTYQYTEDAIEGSKEATLYALVDKMRTFRHGVSGEPKGYVTIDTAFQEKISRGGCHSMSELITDLSINLNIPGYRDYGWYGYGHVSALFPNIGILIHGDDVYNSHLTATPSDELLASWTYFKTKIEPMGEPPSVGRLNYWSMRYNALNMLNYVSSSLKDACCIFTICEDRIRDIALFPGHTFFNTEETSCLSESEINNAINKIMATC